VPLAETIPCCKVGQERVWQVQRVRWARRVSWVALVRRVRWDSWVARVRWARRVALVSSPVQNMPVYYLIAIRVSSEK